MDLLLADRIILERLLVNATALEDQLFLKRKLDENLLEIDAIS